MYFVYHKTFDGCFRVMNSDTYRVSEINNSQFIILQRELKTRQLRLIERIFPLLSDIPTVYPEWRRLVVKFGVSGVQVYDARLAATMKANNITYILTFNTGDFIRYASEGIIAVNPGTV